MGSWSRRRVGWLVALLAFVFAACSGGGGSKGAPARSGPTGGVPVGSAKVGRQSDGIVW